MRPGNNEDPIMKTLLLLNRVSRSGRVMLAGLVLLPAVGFAQFPPYYPSPVSPVRITSPANHATFYAPLEIPIFAYASLTYSVNPFLPGLGSITNVEFYAGTNDLGSGFNLGAGAPPAWASYANFVTVRAIPRLGNTYCLTWTNAPTGTFALTVVAKGAGSLAKTSAPVNITILVSATNANPADVLSVVATDPIAIAGTNAWVWRGVTNTVPNWTNWGRPGWVWFTNWGPKNALFTLQRFGDASSNLTVNYILGGTASNGVDYAALPGTLTVPAGSAYALIPIVPIDNGVTNTTKTVTLTLTAATNLPPDYSLGFPPRAAALIYENWLRPSSAVLPDGSFHLAATGPDGAWFYVQYSTDMVNWVVAGTNQVFQGSIDFVDPETAGQTSRFYRVVPVDRSPGQ